MVEAAPFRALRYDPVVAGDPAVTSVPAYDEFERFVYAAHRTTSPYTALDLLREDEPHTAAATVRRWVRTGVLRLDATPGYYRYEQHELRRGVPRVQRGVLAAVRLPEPGTPAGRCDVLTHEDVDDERVERRRAPIEAVRVEVSPIYAFADGPLDELHEVLAARPVRQPLAAFTDAAGVDHRVWAVDDPPRVAAVRRSLSNVRAVIADGHHRYAAALSLRDHRRGRNGPPSDDAGAGSPWERTLLYLVDPVGGGPEVRAVHRLVGSLPADHLARLRACCHVTAAGRDWRPLAAELEHVGGRVVGLYTGNPPAAWLLRPRSRAVPPDGVGAGRSARWRELDTVLLDHDILPRLGVGVDDISYHPDAAAAAAQVDGGAAAGLFLVRPVSLATVSALAAAGEAMPPKTTHIGPKPRAGLVMRPLPPLDREGRSLPQPRPRPTVGP